MTRINVGIAPQDLPDKALLAEHREITRIPNAIREGRAIVHGIPATFRLGPGHVKFFYDKLLYLKKRYISLYEECVRRNFNVTDKRSAFNDLPLNLMGDYSPSDNDKKIILHRLKERGHYG